MGKISGIPKEVSVLPQIGKLQDIAGCYAELKRRHNLHYPDAA